ncbi:unnamed protein product [Paramecium sonneborni]|uniref:Uncharacterized protein n=1 Tax=Paramecium sonneborni TaxID=65129 RepID=A0A8S1ND90_9CILI|nr:unnamed protein product [Paramecium sonneborni]
MEVAYGHYQNILFDKLIFYLVYKIGGNYECIVDITYSISHLVAGTLCCIFSTINFSKG